jgi:acyl-CoA reductase-like NAD-dependent aldehyde dehydrogenase
MTQALASLPLAEATRRFLARGPFGHFIDGRMVPSESGETFEVVDPASGRAFAECAAGSAADVDHTVGVARAAYEDGRWRLLPPAEKERILRRYAVLLEENRELFSDVDVIDGGVVRTYSGFLVQFVAAAVNYYAGWPTKLHGAVPPTPSDMVVSQVREPMGVAAVIVPWNGPSALAASFIPALACGNSVIMKPPEQAPLSSLIAAELAIQAGVPAGVVNILQGFGRVAGQALVEHPGIDVIAFTGSSQTGRHIAATAASRATRVTMELGGKSPHIVFADARLDDAARAAAGSVWGHAGQVCTAGSRVLVQRGIHDALVEKMIAVSKAIRIGHGFDPGTQLGPLISQTQLDRVCHYVETGRSEGADMVLGSGRHGAEGYFHTPTIFVGVSNGMTIAREEIFGPVMSVIPFDDEEEAIAIANDTEFGLAAGVWTQDLDRAYRSAQQLRAGTVWINSYQLVNPAVTYGGMKQSGYGRKLGLQSLDAFTQTKSIWLKLQ